MRGKSSRAQSTRRTSKPDPSAFQPRALARERSCRSVPRENLRCGCHARSSRSKQRARRKISRTRSSAWPGVIVPRTAAIGFASADAASGTSSGGRATGSVGGPVIPVCAGPSSASVSPQSSQKVPVRNVAPHPGHRLTFTTGKGVHCTLMGCAPPSFRSVSFVVSLGIALTACSSKKPLDPDDGGMDEGNMPGDGSDMDMGLPACASGQYEAQQTPAAMLVLLQRSGSMSQTTSGSSQPKRSSRRSISRCSTR